MYRIRPFMVGRQWSTIICCLVGKPSYPFPIPSSCLPIPPLYLPYPFFIHIYPFHIHPSILLIQYTRFSTSTSSSCSSKLTSSYNGVHYYHLNHQPPRRHTGRFKNNYQEPKSTKIRTLGKILAPLKPTNSCKCGLKNRSFAIFSTFFQFFVVKGPAHL